MSTSEKQLQSHMIKEHLRFIRINWEFCTNCMKYVPKQDLNQQKHICGMTKKCSNRYGCQICPFTCSDKISIKSHLKKYHNFKDTDFKSKDTVKRPSKLLCPSCSFSCYDQDVLKAHLNLKVCYPQRNNAEFQTFEYQLVKTFNDIDLDIIDMSLKWLSG